MKLVKAALAAAALVCAPALASAKTYDAFDYNGHRSIWTSGSGMLVSGGSASTLWSVTKSKLEVDGAAGTGVLTGSAVNTGDSNLSLTFKLNFAENTGANPGYCQHTAYDPMCANPAPGVDPSSWTYADMTSGMFTGTGALSGVTWALASISKHAPQFGVGANAFDIYDDGWSMWFRTTAMYDDSLDLGVYSVNKTADYGRGDFNMDLAAVPLPAAGWMLIAALGGLIGLRRRAA